MTNKTYRISKTKKIKEAINIKLDKLDGYKVKPKVKEKNAIGVDKIVFVDDEFSEKIIRRKIDKKIDSLLKELKFLEDEDDGNNGNIKKSLMDAEKLRVQIINNYVKYLGHTYYSLTLKKIELIIEQLRYKLYLNEYKKEEKIYYENEKEGRRGR